MREKYLIKTYGCQMNEHDSEIMSFTLESMGYRPTKDVNDAKIIIYNTCAIRKNAENKVYGNLGWLKGDSKNDDKILCVCGCMMQSPAIRQEIIDKYKNVNVIFGTHNIDKLDMYIKEYLRTGQTVVDIQDKNTYIDKTFHAVRPYKFKSFVNIAYGCNNFCSFCIVPYTRGRERSRTMEDIIEEVKYLVDDGVREIMLLGQNVNSYGKSFRDGTSFNKLLIELNKIRDLKRIRFMTPHPRDVTDEFLESYVNLEKLMPQLHLPVQSGSSKVLKDMRRYYDREKYLKIIEDIKRLRPDISLSTDIIVGYPTETEEDFKDTLSLVNEVRYDSSFTFIYSPRPHTPAAKLEGLDEEVVKERFGRLSEAMNRIQLENHKTNIGKTYSVLAEEFKEDENTLQGRNEYGRLTLFKGDKSDVGKIIEVKVNDVNTFTSFGTQVN